jgi:hypothetical protein
MTEQQRAVTVLNRLVHDLNAIARMIRNDSATASERLTAILGEGLFKAVRLSLVASEGRPSLDSSPGDELP